MKQFIFLSLLFFSTSLAVAQLNIEDCYSKARANYPLIKQYGLIEKSEKYNLSNANKGYLPQIILSAKASYQSDVTELPIDFSQLGIPGVNISPLSKDQYGTSIDVNQLVWDGGMIRSKKESIRAASETDRKKLEVDLYSINERINQVFFGILLLEAQIEQSRLYREELQRNYDRFSSWMQNGIANQADLDAVKVEQLKASQNESLMNHTKNAYLDILSALIGEKLDPSTMLKKPETAFSAQIPVRRPELDLFQAQIKGMEAQNEELNASLMPRLGVFLTGGYGKPGLSMLENDFSTYYIAGVKLSWTISNFYSNQNNKQKIQNSIASIRTQQETFLFNTNLDISRKNNEIKQFQDQLKYDDEIIALRKSIKQASEIKMENGTITATDLMRDINAEDSARQSKILHEIEMLLAIYNLKFTTNN